MQHRLEAFLTPESIAALDAVKAKPAARVRVLVPLDLPDVEPMFGEDCPKCQYVLYLRVVLWPPGLKPKGGPGEAWWCGRCERYYVYQEIRDAKEEGAGGSPEAQLSPVRRADGGNGDLHRVR